VPSSAAEVQEQLRALADSADAAFLAGFFKTGPGQYGEGDVFIGVRVPATRAVVRRHRDLPLDECALLLDSPVHEDRLAGLLILVDQFLAAGMPRTRDDVHRARLHSFYLDAVRRGRVDNWDLVDSSAEYLVGQHLRDIGTTALLRDLARSRQLWERRVAMLATFAFIKSGDAAPTFEIAELLLEDRHDLIQKAVGWMLREAGKRVARDELIGFLELHAGRMPRTALSYATEHLSPGERARFRAMPRA